MGLQYPHVGQAHMATPHPQNAAKSQPKTWSPAMMLLERWGRHVVYLVDFKKIGQEVRSFSNHMKRIEKAFLQTLDEIW